MFRTDPFGQPPYASRISGALRLTVTVAVLVLLWQITDVQKILNLLSGVDLPWLLAAFVTAHLQIILSALRWKLTAARLDQNLTPGEAIGEYYLSQLINSTLPGGILGDAGRAVRQRHRAGLARAAQAVVIERLAGQIALFAVMLGGFVAVGLFPGWLVLPAWVAELVLWILAAICAAVVVVLGLRLVPGIVSRVSDGFLQAARTALFARDVWYRQAGLSLLIVASNLSTLAFCAAATGTALPIAAIVTVLPLILTAMLIPLSVGGWGLREGAAAAIWPVLGSPPEAGIAASVVFGIVILIATLPGIWVLLRQMRRGSGAV